MVRIHIAKHHSPTGQRAILVLDCLAFLKVTNMPPEVLQHKQPEFRVLLEPLNCVLCGIKAILLVMKVQSITL